VLPHLEKGEFGFMKNIRTAILAVCIGTLGSLALQAQSYTNTADGGEALSQNRSGIDNSAFGTWALSINDEGSDNTATGFQALDFNVAGSQNTADGSNALLYNFGSQNTAVGFEALYNNSVGGQNTASGYNVLLNNTTGSLNVAIGAWALAPNKAGSSNVGVGYAAGYYNSPAAHDNIDIGNWGSANDIGTVRIGSGGQTSFYVAGVYGVGVGSGVPVVINSNGQLGTVNSSIRFKEDVHDMAAASDGLMKLRPVTYRYKEAYADGSKPVDYGLIAEEVAEVYPDLVVKNADGQIQTVQYQKLTPMLLNEVQKEHKQLEEQKTTIQELEKRLAALEAALPSVKPEANTETK
jgi:hypothetical protein